ncbi:hypothetical protein [Nocardia sp. NPDC057440]|uniref:hypothetical protein n=1 Tax=Nocardia sp. NPDC057440 TaxID=3346134 RepID=UPI003672DAC7
MKVKIEFTLDIDPESWRMNYGIESLADIRADAKWKAKNDLRAHWAPKIWTCW